MAVPLIQSVAEQARPRPKRWKGPTDGSDFNRSVDHRPDAGLVFLGMRVAFAAGLAGFVGLVWLRWNGFDYDPERFGKALEISVKVAGQVPHSKCRPMRCR